jgi:hypothetical protein
MWASLRFLFRRKSSIYLKTNSHSKTSINWTTYVNMLSAFTEQKHCTKTKGAAYSFVNYHLLQEQWRELLQQVHILTPDIMTCRQWGIFQTCILLFKIEGLSNFPTVLSTRATFRFSRHQGNVTAESSSVHSQFQLSIFVPVINKLSTIPWRRMGRVDV